MAQISKCCAALHGDTTVESILPAVPRGTKFGVAATPRLHRVGGPPPPPPPPPPCPTPSRRAVDRHTAADRRRHPPHRHHRRPSQRCVPGGGAGRGVCDAVVRGGTGRAGGAGAEVLRLPTPSLSPRSSWQTGTRAGGQVGGVGAAPLPARPGAWRRAPAAAWPGGQPPPLFPPLGVSPYTLPPPHTFPPPPPASPFFRLWAGRRLRPFVPAPPPAPPVPTASPCQP